MTDDKKLKVFCIVCKGERNHVILYEHVYDESKDGIDYTEKSQVIQCAGCDTVTFRKESVCSEDYDPFTGEYEINENLYPLRNEHTLTIKRYYNVPTSLRTIYRETVDAYNNGLYILCAGGLRAVIEGICSVHGIKGGTVNRKNSDGTVRCDVRENLEGRINGLFEKGLITQRHAEILHEHRFLGNDALHILQTISHDQLKIAIEIVEHTLDYLYEISDKAISIRYLRMGKQSPFFVDEENPDSQ